MTDSLGNTATIPIEVSAGVALSPPTLSLPPRGGQTFAVSGGSGNGYVFSLTTSGSGAGATIDAAMAARNLARPVRIIGRSPAYAGVGPTADRTRQLTGASPERRSSSSSPRKRYSPRP